MFHRRNQVEGESFDKFTTEVITIGNVVISKNYRRRNHT